MNKMNINNIIIRWLETNLHIYCLHLQAVLIEICVEKDNYEIKWFITIFYNVYNKMGLAINFVCIWWFFKAVWNVQSCKWLILNKIFVDQY